MIQFPKLEHATLPSVEDWGTNTNILRDPPKSLFTRKIDKVGQDSQIVQEIDDSGDRACEYIRVYARGTNPMVSVSYQNSGGNAFGSQVSQSGHAQAFLPYRVAIDGSFRPPVLTGRDLLPISRQPRAFTKALTMPTFADYSKKMSCPDKLKEVKDVITTLNVKPNAIFNIKRPLTATYDVKDNVVNRIKIEGKSGMKERDILMHKNQENFSVIDDDKLQAYGQTNISVSRNTANLNNLHMDSSRYLQDGNYTHAYTQHKYGEQNLVLGEVELDGKVQVYDVNAPLNDSRVNKIIMHENDLDKGRNLPEYNFTAPVSDKRVNKTMLHDHEERVYERVTPLTSMTVNAGAKYGIDEISSRKAYLAPKVNAGGFDGKGFQPTFNGDSQKRSLRDEKHELNKTAYSFFEARYGNN